MILRVKKIDISILLLHITLMRKSAKKVFKRNYNKAESKELLKSYDDVKNGLEMKMEEVNGQVENTIHQIHYNKADIDMLQSFLTSYIPELEKTLKTAGKEQIEDKKQIDHLKSILHQLNNLSEVEV